MADSKKRKRLSKNDIKKELLESTITSETIESEELNREAEGVQDLKEAAKVIEKYEYIIKTKKKGITSIRYHQGKVFKKFKEKEKFVKLGSQLGIHKNTIIFKLMFLNCVKDTLNYWGHL